MEAELRLHLDLETEMLIAGGLDPREARDIARQRFGSVARVKDDCRESWGLLTESTLLALAGGLLGLACRAAAIDPMRALRAE